MEAQPNIILVTAGYDKLIKYWNIKNYQSYETKKFGDNAVNKL